MRICTVITAICLVFSPMLASAQHHSLAPAAPRLIISERAITAGMSSAPARAPAAQRNDDSLKNGAVIGAIVGAAVFGGFVTFLCNALQEPSDPSCLGSSLMGIGIGAGIGAAGGAGIDALLAKPQQSPRVKQMKGT